MATTDNYIAVDEKRYDQLIRAEHDANQLKALIAEKVDGLGSFSREELKLLYAMFISNKEEK